MILDATQNGMAPLTAERPFDWLAAPFPTGRSSMSRMIVGGRRASDSGPMQAVSEPIGRGLSIKKPRPRSRLPVIAQVAAAES